MRYVVSTVYYNCYLIVRGNAHQMRSKCARFSVRKKIFCKKNGSNYGQIKKEKRQNFLIKRLNKQKCLLGAYIISIRGLFN